MLLLRVSSTYYLKAQEPSTKPIQFIPASPLTALCHSANISRKLRQRWTQGAAASQDWPAALAWARVLPHNEHQPCRRYALLPQNTVLQSGAEALASACSSVISHFSCRGKIHFGKILANFWQFWDGKFVNFWHFWTNFGPFFANFTFI